MSCHKKKTVLLSALCFLFQAFTFKFVEIGKILFTTAVLKSTPSHQVKSSYYCFIVAERNTVKAVLFMGTSIHGLGENCQFVHS